MKIAILVVLTGFSLFLLIAVQAGTNFRPAAAQEEDSLKLNEIVAPLRGYLGFSGDDATSISTGSAVATEGPVVLTIPKIGVVASVEHVGLNAKNEIGIPKSYQNVAWYTGSPKPGETGTSIIDGHLNDRLSRPAVFWDLHTLVKGDRVYVKDAKGITYIYEVQESATYDLANAPMAKIMATGPGAHLNLITCTGTWIQTQRMYDKRLVVFTELVGTM